MTIAFGTYIYASILGPDSGIQYVFLALIAFTFGIFNQNEIPYKIGISICSLILFFILYLSDFAFFIK